jgi:uncharacterized protein YdeI (YjbR/CyaY-like superfamily)
MEVRFFATQAEFRTWFLGNHDKLTEQWVGFYKKGSGKPSITWPESVDVALCVGWIDGIRKSIDEECYKIRFTPRRPRSIWSAVNIKRANELLGLGLMHPDGIAAFEKRDDDRSRVYAYEQKTIELSGEFLAKFRKRKKAWIFFESQPPSYRKPAIWWVMSAKQETTRLKRLETLIADPAEGLSNAQMRPLK